MELNHSFTVPVTVEQAWEVLRDIERVAPCMPGAAVTEVDGDEFAGRVKVKLGPMQVTYKGTAAFTEVDDEQHRATIEAKGQETRGSGTAGATVTAELTERDGTTEVNVLTELAVTGKPAQFGRGVMSDVGDKLLGQFAECLAQRLAGEPTEEEVAAADAAAAESAGEATGEESAEARGGVDMRAEPSVTPAAARMLHGGEEDGAAVNLFDVAGGSIARRVAPALGALAFVGLIVYLIRRRC